MNNEKETIDWERLKKALLVEAGRGLQNIQGKQYIFCLLYTSPSPRDA